MRLNLSGLAVLAGLSMFSAPANAAVVTKTYSFRATDFTSSDPAINSPQAVVTGRFTIQFDDQVATSSTTTGVTLNSLSFLLGSPLAASYVPAIPFLGLAANLQVGGLQQTVNVVSSGTNDFFLEFSDVLSDAPVFRQFFYTQADTPAAFRTLTGSIAVVDAVPEPATWAMMIGGFGMIGAVARRGTRANVLVA